jgi:hypothetical protein
VTSRKLDGELVPGKKVVWHVLDAKINFVRDKADRNGTDIIFEITKKGDKTELRFTMPAWFLPSNARRRPRSRRPGLRSARCPRRRYVRIGDLVSVPGDLVDQGAQRLGETRVVKRCAAVILRRRTVSFEDSLGQCFACLSVVRHVIPV